jgi:hypothetical protein
MRTDKVNRDGGFPVVRNHRRRNGSDQASHLPLVCVFPLVLVWFQSGRWLLIKFSLATSILVSLAPHSLVKAVAQISGQNHVLWKFYKIISFPYWYVAIRWDGLTVSEKYSKW